jgi:hypothetical protein
MFGLHGWLRLRNGGSAEQRLRYAADHDYNDHDNDHDHDNHDNHHDNVNHDNHSAGDDPDGRQLGDGDSRVGILGGDGLDAEGT